MQTTLEKISIHSTYENLKKITQKQIHRYKKRKVSFKYLKMALSTINSITNLIANFFMF